MKAEGAQLMSAQQHRHRGYQVYGIVAGLLVLLLLGTGAWSQGQGLHTEDTRQRSATQGRAVVVHQGRLSVDVRAADLGEVLAQIGQQAGMRIAVGPSTGKKVSARFTGVELEEGLRRLLRLASLNHLFLYAPGPAGTVAIAEVRVVGEGQADPPRPATVAEPSVPENEQHLGTPSHKARRQARMGGARPAGSAANEVPELVPDVVESTPEPTPEPGQGEPSEAMRRVLDVFKLSKQMAANPLDGPAASPPAPQSPGHAPGDIGGGFSR
jgi:type II secretory pathway component GspD/PulD (secretin)